MAYELVEHPRSSFLIYSLDVKSRTIRICVKNRWFPLQADAFRGHGFSLLAPARGMPALPAKGGFSRPSLKTCACVF